MAYLLLLALVFTVGFIFLILPPKKSKQYSAGISFGLGLGFLGLGYICQLVLGFHLDPDFARLFYWSREMMALAWLGHGLLFLLFGDRKQVRWLTYGLVLASIVSLILVAGTQVTRAEDWFRPAIPIYSQINDLLATNRPTRWAVWVLNAYGATILVVTSFSILRAKKPRRLAALLLIGGTASLFLPLLLSPVVRNAEFYLLELVTSIAFYFGMSALSPARKRVNAS